ncbi:MAG: PepSY-like domain-containing protein [Candidatus Nanopelagicales bacterium]
METKSIAIVAGAAAAGGVLALAGLNLATAATGSQDAVMGQRAPMAGQYGMGQGGPGGPHGTPVTGEAADKVTAAVQAQYPDATVMFVEEEDGGYEAHVRKSEGTMVHVTLDADFQITGEHTGPAMGPGGPGGPHGTPVTGEAADKVTAAVQAQYPDATVMFVEEQDGGYEAHVRKSDGTMVHVTLDADFQITGEHTGPAMGGPGRMGPGHHGKPVTGAKAKKVRAAAKAELPSATVIRVEKDRNGYEAHMVKTNGTHVLVSVGKGFRVTDVETFPAPGQMGRSPAVESDPASA